MKACRHVRHVRLGCAKVGDGDDSVARLFMRGASKEYLASGQSASF